MNPECRVDLAVPKRTLLPLTRPSKLTRQHLTRTSHIVTMTAEEPFSTGRTTEPRPSDTVNLGWKIHIPNSSAPPSGPRPAQRPAAARPPCSHPRRTSTHQRAPTSTTRFVSQPYDQIRSQPLLWEQHIYNPSPNLRWARSPNPLARSSFSVVRGWKKREKKKLKPLGGKRRHIPFCTRSERESRPRSERTNRYERAMDVNSKRRMELVDR